MGNAFELNAYGVNFTQKDLRQARDFIKQWIKQQRQKKEENQRKGNALNDLLDDFDSLEEGKYTWDGNNWIRE